VSGGRIWAIALNSFREAIRNKVLYGILAFAVILILVAMAVGVMSLHEEARVARDVSVAGVSLFGGITAVYLGVSMLYNEIQKKTIHTILAKPIERHEFVLGKYLGMAFTLTIMTALFTAALAAQLRLQEAHFTAAISKAIVLAYGEVLVVAAIAVFFSSFSSPFLSGIFTVSLWILGRLGDLIVDAARGATLPIYRWLARAALWVVPDLHLFAISGSDLDGQHVSVHGSFVTWGYVGHAGAYAAVWIMLLLVLAALIFRRRDFV
jgi:Cu-processing system permease protein